MVKIAEAFVEISASTRVLEEQLKKATSKAKRGGQAIAKAIAVPVIGAFDLIRQAMAKLFGFFAKWAKRLGLVIIAGIGISTKLAADAQETQSKFEAVFRNLSGSAERFGKSLANDVGRSFTEIQGGLATFQAFFVGLEFAPKQAAALSKELSKAAIDFASFHNLSESEAIQRFISALSGSGEVLDRFGVNIKEAAINQELLSLGFKTTQQGAKESEKAIARFNIIMRAMGDQGAMGDALRTSGSFVNQLKRLRAASTELGIAIGNIFIKGGAFGAGGLAKVLKGVTQAINRNADMIRAKIAQLASFIKSVLSFIFSRETLAAVVGLVAKIGQAIGFIISKVVAFGKAIRDALGLQNVKGGFLRTLVAGFENAFIRIREIIKGVMSAIPNFVEGVILKIRAAGKIGPAKTALNELADNFFEIANRDIATGFKFGTALSNQNVGNINAGTPTNPLSSLEKWITDFGLRFIVPIEKMLKPRGQSPALFTPFANIQALLDMANHRIDLSSALGAGGGAPSQEQIRHTVATVSTAIGAFKTGATLPGVREQKKTNEILNQINSGVQNIQNMGGVLT